MVRSLTFIARRARTESLHLVDLVLALWVTESSVVPTGRHGGRELEPELPTQRQSGIALQLPAKYKAQNI